MNVSGVGGSLTRIRPKVAEDYEIPLAPKEQQKRIVAKIEELFSHIDAGIEALKKAKQLLKQYRQSVLKAAVTGELTKEWREANKDKLEPASQLLERILKERRQKWEHEQLRKFTAKGLSAPKKGVWWLYVLLCDDNSFYIGVTEDMPRRWEEHVSCNGSEHTKKHKPISIIHHEEFKSQKEAYDREKELKTGYGRKWLKREYEKGALRQAGKMPKDDKWKQKYKLEEPNPHMILDVPEEWAVSTLESITDPIRIICYGILMPKENIKNGVLYVKVKDIKGGKVLLEQLNRTAPEIANKYERASLCEGDVLLTIRGTYGRTAIAPVELEGGNITQDTVRISAIPPISNEYLQLFIDSNIVQHYFKVVARGVAVKGVNVQDVRNMNVSIPSRAEQEEIIRQVDEKVTSITHLENELDVQLIKAEKNKQSILVSAFSGKLLGVNM